MDEREPQHDDDLIEAALDRLEWLREEYGPDDLDYLTFAPVLDLLTTREN